MDDLQKQVISKYSSQRPSQAYQNPDSLSTLSNIESLKERRSVRRANRNLRSGEGSLLSEGSIEKGRQSQIQNLAQDEYYTALKAFQTENSHRTIETNYQKQRSKKVRQKSETTKSGIYDFKRNTEKINNQVPERQTEIMLTEIPKTYQKQLIDQIVREMTNEKMESLYQKKQQEQVREKEKQRNSKSQQQFARVYRDHLQKKNSEIHSKISRNSSEKNLQPRALKRANLPQEKPYETESQNSGSIRLSYLRRLKEKNKTSRFNEDL